jgi:putative transcriptional regulator
MAENGPSLAPALLISMPQLVDPNFNRAVVLLIRHSGKDGAFGLILNRPLVTTGRVVVNREAGQEMSAEHELHIWVGGPVEPQRSWMLVGESDEAEAQGVRIAEGLYLSTSPDLLGRLLEPSPPDRVRLIVGYAGWSSGQLEAELQASAWLLSDVDANLIFETPPERMWETAIRRLGADPASLQMSRGIH